MISMPCHTHCLTDSAERACAETRLPRTWASVTATAISSSVIGVNSAGRPAVYSPEGGGCDRLLGHWRELGRDARDVLAGEVQLDRVHPVLEEHAHRLPHLLRPVDDGPEAELRIRQVWERLVTEAAGHRDLLTGRQVARPRDLARLDGVAHHHVEA